MPTYASIMVGLDLARDADARVRLAAGLADRFGARIIGVGGRQPIVTVVAETAFTTGAVLEQDQREATESLRQIETAYRRVVGPHVHSTVRTAVESSGRFFVTHSRAADLLVVGRNGRDDDQDPLYGINPGDVALQAGRPILVTPPGTSRLSAKRIVIAWKDTREARRAVRDALPLLREAERVFIVSDGDTAGQESALDMQEYLGLHQTKVTFLLHLQGDAQIADQLIQIAEQEGADLIVSGAYGHSRMREWILGGVTRELLNHAPVCCLMSH